MTAMNDIQELLDELRARKWTDTAIADELGVHHVTVQNWRSGKFYPRGAKTFAGAMRQMLKRKRIPKQKRGRRYSKRLRNVEEPEGAEG